MPINYSRRLTGRHRSQETNRHLGFILAFVAGAINAGGFLAVHQYTSHMTGIVSSMADHIALGMFDLALAGAGALLSFVSGAVCSAMLIGYSRRHRMHSEFAFPLVLEASLLLCFGLLGPTLAGLHGPFVSATVMLLCFMMGLQNAVITKLSKTEIRTTHITGLVTDIGIELGKQLLWISWSRKPDPQSLQSRERLRVLAFMAANFFIGGILGAVGFKDLGYISTVPLALILLALAIAPIGDDIKAWLKRW